MGDSTSKLEACLRGSAYCEQKNESANRCTFAIADAYMRPRPHYLERVETVTTTQSRPELFAVWKLGQYGFGESRARSGRIVGNPETSPATGGFSQSALNLDSCCNIPIALIERDANRN